ncbi:MAG: mucoidy inhibitor MuiA family protein [Flavobacteriales bacterium]|nr:mucoidy inhibitor MuiA family protein [Flavobacteriales bacterium]
MKKLIFILAAFLAQPVFAQEATDITAKSDIRHVTVYLDGAEITREANVNLASGRNRILFKGLSPQVNPSSIRVTSAEDLSILSINNEINYLDHEESQPRIAMLRDSVEKVNRQLTRVNDDRDAYNTEKNMLLKNQSLGGQNNGVSVTDLKLAADYFRNRTREINNAISDLNERSTELTKTRNRLQQQLNELNAKSQYVRGEVTITVNASRTTSTRITLSYMIRDAGWVPVYDIRATDANQPIQLTYKAKVFNNSQIDWKNVPLTLSTANPSQQASKPELNPWYLAYRNIGGKAMANFGTFNKQEPEMLMVPDQKAREEAAPRKAYGNEGVTLDEIRKDSGYGETRMMLPHNQGTMLEIADLNISFDIKDKYTIPSDTKPYMVEVGQHTLNATYQHFAIPKVESAAFLLARVSGWENMNLVTGYANIYFDGTYLGQSFINTAEITDTLDISLGRDSKVMVSRETVKEFTSKKTIGANVKESYGYKITVKNTRSGNIDLTVLDQLPVSQNSEIEVSPGDLAGAEHNALTGELKWHQSVTAGQSQAFNFGYSVKYPKNKPIETQQIRSQNVRYF